MALCSKHQCGGLQDARQAVSRQCVPRIRRLVCRYRASGEGQHKDQQYLLYTSEDPTHGGISPESHSVLLCLMEKKVPFREVKVDLASKPQEFVELYHSIIPDKDVRERVPVLVYGPKRLVDCVTIVDYLATAYPDSGTQLSPPDAYAAARVKLFTQYFMDHVVPAYTHLIHTSEGQGPGAKEALMKALAAVDEFLALHGAGEGEYAVGPHYGFTMTSMDQGPSAYGGSPHEHYLMGPFYTTAEVLCTPFVARMVHTLPDWRGMDVLKECEQHKLHRVAGWMKACLARPAAQMTGPNRKELVDGLVEWEWSHAM